MYVQFTSCFNRLFVIDVQINLILLWNQWRNIEYLQDWNSGRPSVKTLLSTTIFSEFYYTTLLVSRKSKSCLVQFRPQFVVVSYSYFLRNFSLNFSTKLFIQKKCQYEVLQNCSYKKSVSTRSYKIVHTKKVSIRGKR